jgi:hypothetical protein
MEEQQTQGLKRQIGKREVFVEEIECINTKQKMGLGRIAKLKDL